MIKSNEQIIRQTNVSLDKLREFNNSLESQLSVLKKDDKFFIKYSGYTAYNGYQVKERLSPSGYETLDQAKAQIEFYLKSLYLAHDIKVGDKIQATKYVEPYGENDFWVQHGIVTKVTKDEWRKCFDVNEFEIEARFNDNYGPQKRTFNSSELLKIQ